MLAPRIKRAQPAIAFADMQPFLRREEKGHGHEIRGALALRQSSVWLHCCGGIQRRDRGTKSPLRLRQRHEEGLLAARVSLPGFLEIPLAGTRSAGFFEGL